MRPLLYILLLVLTARCSVLQNRRSEAAEFEFKRPSNPEFRGTVPALPSSRIEEMDTDLSRRHWMTSRSSIAGTETYRFEVVVTPLTLPLLERMLREEALESKLSTKDTQTRINNFTRALIHDQSCFEVFIKSPSQVGLEYKVDYYAISYQAPGMKPISARPLLFKAKYSSLMERTRHLLDTYLPVGVWDTEPRNIRGIGFYSRQVLCGPRIDMQAPFRLHIRPRYDLSLEAKTLYWETPALAE